MYPAPPINRSFRQSLRDSVELNGISRNRSDLYQTKLGELLLKDTGNTKNVTNGNERQPRKRSVNSSTARSNHQELPSSRQLNNEIIPGKRAVPLINSRLSGTLQERIQRERRSHTMAPLTRISGPSSTPKANLFATTTAPDQSHQFTPEFSKIAYGISDIEMTDDDTPVIVKVRYDPRASVLPTEDAVRKAISHQICDRKRRRDPIVVDFSGPNKQLKLSKPIPNRVALQPSYTFPSTSRPPQSFLRYKKNYPSQVPKPAINRQISRHMSPALTNGVYPKGFNNSKSIYYGMANQQSSGNEVFRPPPVKDIPELSRENLLNMLNQIPDLQGRRFNIEYAPPTAPDGYPIPLQHLDSTNNTYPEPVVIDKLPNNIIQHVKSSNNPALTAALEATIQQEQQQLQSHPPTIMHYAAQPNQQVQQSRPVSSDDSDSSTDDSSSSEETDYEESQQPTNRLPFVGPMPPTFYSHS